MRLKSKGIFCLSIRLIKKWVRFKCCENLNRFIKLIPWAHDNSFHLWPHLRWGNLPKKWSLELDLSKWLRTNSTSRTSKTLSWTQIWLSKILKKRDTKSGLRKKKLGAKQFRPRWRICKKSCQFTKSTRKSKALLSVLKSKQNFSVQLSISLKLRLIWVLICSGLEKMQQLL